MDVISAFDFADLGGDAALIVSIRS